MACKIVVDTNVLVGACLGGGPANQVLRLCLTGHAQALVGAALFYEYDEVFHRAEWAEKSPLTSQQRQELLDIFLGACRWVRVYFGWRPNLPDEADNHLMELAIAGGASHIVTRNLRHLGTGELRFQGLTVCDPKQFLEEFSP